MMRIEGESLQKVWFKLLRELLFNHEYKVAPRDFMTKEKLGVVIRIEDMRNNILFHPVRNLNYKYLVAEWLWIALGMEDLATLTQYNGQMGRFSDDGKVLAGAYGPRLATQWQYVIDTLKKESISRQAVATIWTPNPAPSKDIPCTISLQFLVRDKKLNVIVTMRSSDVWLGIPYDVFTFSMLANSIAGTLDLEPGFIQLQLGSSHIYQDNWDKALVILGQGRNTDPAAGYLANSIRSPLLPAFPPQVMREALQDPMGTAQPIGSGIVNVLLPPWGKYLQVLRALTWSEARRLLSEE